MNFFYSNDTEVKKNKNPWLLVQIVFGTLLLALLVGPAVADNDEATEPFGATSVIIETTDNDIELQVFVDGFLYQIATIHRSWIQPI